MGAIRPRVAEDHMTFADVRRKAAPKLKTALLGMGCYAVLRHMRPSRVLGILRYHAICGSEGYRYADPSICISPAAFERHVSYLASNYRVLPLPEAVAALERNKSLPANAVAVTFDDGYADNLWAARLLAQYGVTGTFFLTSGCIGGEQPFWPAEVRTLIADVPAPDLRLTLKGKTLELPLHSPQDRLAAIDRVTRLFKSHPIPERERLREELRAQAATPSVPSVMLTWKDAVEMHELGMTIGAHTLTHANLPSAGLKDATREIVGSKERIEQALDTAVTMFAYPNGGAEEYYTPELQRVVAAAGFRAAFSSRNGFARLGSDKYALERIQVAERLEDLLFALEVERFAFKPPQIAAC
jgi:peptidoglycan/xylan/chitin deacetylase (PgdA/CDA1 family)